MRISWEVSKKKFGWPLLIQNPSVCFVRSKADLRISDVATSTWRYGWNFSGVENHVKELIAIKKPINVFSRKAFFGRGQPLGNTIFWAKTEDRSRVLYSRRNSSCIYRSRPCFWAVPWSGWSRCYRKSQFYEKNFWQKFYLQPKLLWGWSMTEFTDS